MSTVKKAGVLIGSLRKESYSRKIAKAAIALAPASLSFNIIEIGGVSFFNQDHEAEPPADWVGLRQEIKANDAILFVTAEYNRSIPGVLKNAIDVGSRPYGQSAFNAKPAGVISTSIGAVGGFGANHHLRQSLAFLNMPTLAQPEMYLGNSSQLVDEAGEVTNDATRDYLVSFGIVFADWINKLSD